jgi:3-hydroxybutyryl-CoA dehydrogenase
LLLDASKELLEQGHQKLVVDLAHLVNKGKVAAADRDATLARVRPVTDFQAFSVIDFMIEAVTEILDVKQRIFRSADEVTAPHVILASNTSSISVTKLAATTRRPDKVIGMHFMNPVPLMKLVEIVKALQTSDETLQKTRSLAEAMGKTCITAKDSPGFLVNRILVPLLNEACFALQEELGTPEDIDTGAKLGLNHPMGPLALADLVGLDTVLYIAEILHKELGDDKYRPAPLLRNYVAAGWLGRKSGRGFYDYAKDEKR